MAEDTKIEWATHTMNPWMGCTKVSPGCDRCYAEALMDTRYGRVKWGPHGDRVRTSEANWKLPLRWARKVREQMELFEIGMLTLRPERPRVFCASLADVFDNQVPPEWRTDLFELIDNTPELDWLLLTKRPENIRKMMGPNVFPNVWLGFTAEDQEHFNRRWKIMREIPAAVRFCSYEPAIGPLRLMGGFGVPGHGYDFVDGLSWLICGGESGHGHRRLDPKWEEDIRRDCSRAGVAYFFKQLSGKKPIPEGFPIVRQFPEVRP